MGVMLDAFAVASPDLAPIGAQAVRVSVLSTALVRSATLSMDTSVPATVFPEDDKVRLIFEVPARTWAHAAIARTPARVDVRFEEGTLGTLELRPNATIEVLEDD